jgi:hypothetical protein
VNLPSIALELLIPQRAATPTAFKNHATSVDE